MYFEKLYDWALLPYKYKVDSTAARAKRDMFRSSFTYIRAERQPEFCHSWIKAAELGWRILSPIDIILSPCEQIEISPDTAQYAAKDLGVSEVWTRGKSALALNPPSWLKKYHFKTEKTNETMFIPNGINTFEWRLGWKVIDSSDFSLLTIPSPNIPDLGVEIGLLSPKQLNNIHRTGCSIAFSPQRNLTINRGDEIARLIPISKEAQAL